MNSRREVALALALCLAGGALVLVAAARTWAALEVPAPAPLPGRRTELQGGDLVAGLRALGLLGLAGIAALAATRRTGRVVVGVLLLLAGAAVVTLTAGVLTDVGAAAAGKAQVPAGADLDTSGWPLAAVLGGLLLGLAGLLAALRGRHWAALSARYQTPSARSAGDRSAASEVRVPGEVEAWDALDRGEDPTRSRQPDGP